MDREPAPTLISNGFTDDLFPVDEALRYANKVDDLFPGVLTRSSASYWRTHLRIALSETP